MKLISGHSPALADEVRVAEARARVEREEAEWSSRSAARIRAFVPPPVYVPRHRAEVPAVEPRGYLPASSWIDESSVPA